MRTVKAVVVACLDCAIAERGIILSRETRAELADWLVVRYIGRKATEFVCDIKFGDQLYEFFQVIFPSEPATVRCVDVHRA